MDDNRLIRAIASGDSGALRQFYDRHAPWVVARLRRTLPPEAVEDVLQETFIAVWRGAHAYRPEAAVGAWVWGIARRQAASWARRHRRPLAAPLASAEDPALLASSRVDLQRALAQLGEGGGAQVELMRLFFIEGRSIADVAGLLGIPAGTVKSRIHALRRRLQCLLS